MDRVREVREEMEAIVTLAREPQMGRARLDNLYSQEGLGIKPLARECTVRPIGPGEAEARRPVRVLEIQVVALGSS